MRLIVDAGREEDGVGIAAVPAVTQPQTPQTRDRDRPMLLVAKLSFEVAVEREGIDAPIAEVANQQVRAEAAELRGRDGEAPRRVERAARRNTAIQRTVGIEDIDEPVARARHVVV